MNARFIPLLISAALLLGACGTNESDPAGEPEGNHGAAAADFERGPHRGRLLRDGDFALEVTIFETGVPPQFHLYAYRNDEALPAQDVSATIELSRLGGKVDRFEFTPDGDHLVGSGTVVEPHSFDVTVTARHGDRDHRWTYQSYEGRTRMPAAVAEAAGVTIETAGPAVIRNNTRLMGRVVLNGDRFAEVKARFPGPVQSVHVKLGDTVRSGQALAVVENRDSLRSYTVTAPISGVVLARHTNVGDVAGDGPLFEIADLSEVWARFARVRQRRCATAQWTDGAARGRSGRQSGRNDAAARTADGQRDQPDRHCPCTAAQCRGAAGARAWR